LRDAWNCTLREYCILVESKKNKNVFADASDAQEQADIIENFKLMEIYARG